MGSNLKIFVILHCKHHNNLVSLCQGRNTLLLAFHNQFSNLRVNNCAHSLSIHLYIPDNLSRGYLLFLWPNLTQTLIKGCQETLNEVARSRVKVVSDHGKLYLFRAYMLSSGPCLADTLLDNSFGYKVCINLEPRYNAIQCYNILEYL